MNRTQKIDFLLNAACLAVLTATAFVFLRYLLRWLLPFLLALAAAAAMEPAIRFLQRRFRFRRGFSAAVLTLFLLFVLGGLLALVLSVLFAQATGFLTQAAALLDTLPALSAQLLARLRQVGALCPTWLQDFLTQELSNYAAYAGAALNSLAARALSFLGSLAGSVPRAVLSAATTLLAVYFTSAAYPTLSRTLRTRLSARWLRRLRFYRSGASRSLARYLRAQALLCTLTFLQLLLGFLLLRTDYALLAASLTTLVDALPVFGTGTVLVPWALAELLLGSTPRGVALLALYLSTLLVRNIMEPKVMAAQAGLPPIASLAAMYLGFCLFGVSGMLLFPFLLLLISQLRRENGGEAA